MLNLHPETFGLSLSDTSLEIIKLKKKGKVLDVVSFNQTALPSGLIKAGEIKKEDELAKIIKLAVKKVKGEKLKTKYVLTCLPEEKAFLRVIKMPYLSPEDLKSAVIYEAENYIPLPIEQAYLDFQVVKPTDHGINVLITALPKTTVNPYLSCLKKAGLKPLVFETESMSLVRALIKDGFSAQPVLLVDLGQVKTNFIIFSGSAIHFTASSPVSSSDTSEQIIQDIKKYLDFYQSHDSAQIKKIILSGTRKDLEKLKTIFSAKLRLTIEIGVPGFKNSLFYVRAIGLALRGIEQKL